MSCMLRLLVRSSERVFHWCLLLWRLWIRRVRILAQLRLPEPTPISASKSSIVEVQEAFVNPEARRTIDGKFSRFISDEFFVRGAFCVVPARRRLSHIIGEFEIRSGHYYKVFSNSGARHHGPAWLTPGNRA